MNIRILSLCCSIALHTMAMAVIMACLGSRLSARLPDGAPVVTVTFVSPDDDPPEVGEASTAVGSSSPFSVSAKTSETPVTVDPVQPETVKLEAVAAPRVPVLNPAALIQPLAGSKPPVTLPDVPKVNGNAAGATLSTTSMAPGMAAHPAYRRNAEPAYPESARRRGQQGTVILAVKVTAEGKALHVDVKRSSGFILLDQAALRAVRGWEFEPARINSLKVDSEIEVPVEFKILEHSA